MDLLVETRLHASGSVKPLHMSPLHASPSLMPSKSVIGPSHQSMTGNFGAARSMASNLMAAPSMMGNVAGSSMFISGTGVDFRQQRLMGQGQRAVASQMAMTR